VHAKRAVGVTIQRAVTSQSPTGGRKGERKEWVTDYNEEREGKRIRAQKEKGKINSLISYKA